MIENLLRMFSIPVYASGEGLESPLPFASIFGVVGSFLPTMVGIIGFVLLGYLLYGGFLWMTSAGDPERLNQAKDTMVNAVIGFSLFGIMLGLFWFLTVGILGVNWGEIIGGVG